MIAEAKFKHALVDMLKTMSLEDINVTSLCAKCNCHRQTFYYHYQDIYDLIAAIFLNENVENFEQANSFKDSIDALINYCKGNFGFLKSTYNSAAHELAEDFVYGKILTKLLYLETKGKTLTEAQINVYRNSSRRFSHIIADEFGYLFRDPSLTENSFEEKISEYAAEVFKKIYPEILKISGKAGA